MTQLAVFFDLNGTLVDTESAYALAYADVLSRFDIKFEVKDFTAHWSIAGKRLGDYLQKIHREDLVHLEAKLLEEKDHIFQELRIMQAT